MAPSRDSGDSEGRSIHDVGVYYRAQAGATLKYIMVVDNAPVYFIQLIDKMLGVQLLAEL